MNTEKKLFKFITLNVPYKYCNLSCDYCYIRQEREFINNSLTLPSPEVIRKALSVKRIGGIALINFCAGGETMMVKELIPIMEELAREGHFISVVTNGTITERINEMIDSEIDLKHVFVKFSFHYLELKRLNKLDLYYENIMKLHKAGVSFTVELVPEDRLIQLIPEIKESTIKNIGALPHLTVPRDNTDPNLSILTDMDMNEYRRIWGDEFKSDMFDFKIKNLYLKRFNDCMAGKYSFAANLENGNIYQCTGNPRMGNLYENMDEPLPEVPVLDKCKLPYCYNGHAYLSLGMVESCDAPYYIDVRDREMVGGEHWVKDEIRNLFTQKIYQNRKN